jgi:hypothetical protein
LRGEEFGGIRTRAGLRLYSAGGDLESAETAEIAETKDTSGVRRGLESGIVATAGA